MAVIIPEKTDAFSRIKKFMSATESGIVLTATEEKILIRLTYAHGLLSERKFTREQIAEKIKDLHGVSIYTARADINNTYTLFATVTEDYKRYALLHHVEFIDQKINQWSNDKSLSSLIPKLLAEKTRALAAMPVDPSTAEVPQPIIIVNITGAMPQTMSANDALKAADELIEFEKTHEYVDFEDLKDEEKQ